MPDFKAEARELARWREATGRDKPGEPVALGCTLTVGRLQVVTETDRFPTALAKSAMSTRKPRKRERSPFTGCAKLAVFGWRGYDQANAQRAAWQRAIETGQWA